MIRILLLLAAMLVPASTSLSATLPSHTLTVFTDRTAETAETVFSPAEKIQAALDLHQLPKGTYEVTIDWISPATKLVQQDHHAFTLETDTEAYRVLFWLKLQAKGPFKQMFSGSEYSRGAYGTWKVQLYWNGETIAEAEFEIAPF